MSGFVGYWGCGAQQELEALLTRCLEALPGTSHRINLTDAYSNGRHPISAGLACWGTDARQERETRNQPHSLAASLSVSGISTDQDVWAHTDDNCLRLGRESFGRATLYWTQLNGAVWFASRLQTLLPILECRDVSIAGLYGYTCFSFVPAPLTPVKNVFAVPAGSESAWRIDGGSKTHSTFTREIARLSEWREGDRQVRSEDKAILELRSLLEDSIRRQVDDLPGGPVAVFLSGGLDSAVTAALLARAGVSARAYTLDFGEYGFSEVPYAERVAQVLSIPLVKVPVSPRQ
ncbi:MAG TPA: asparagine synthase-related protein, partial [Blastocatellia bacterium]|nr:asparagine synthase-related protein [Blastocatellia bacterium]